jgi:hypothetical protein
MLGHLKRRAYFGLHVVCDLFWYTSLFVFLIFASVLWSVCLHIATSAMVVNYRPRRDACVCVEGYVPSYFCIQIFRYSWRSRLSARTEERGRAAFTDFCDAWSTLHVWLAGTQQRSPTQDHLQVSYSTRSVCVQVPASKLLSSQRRQGNFGS